MKMNLVGIALFFVAFPLAAQTSVVAREASNGSFDDLYEAAPECKNTVLQYTTFGPSTKQATDSFKQCEQELHDWVAKAKALIPRVAAETGKETPAPADRGNAKPSVPSIASQVPPGPAREAPAPAAKANATSSTPTVQPRIGAEVGKEASAPAAGANATSSAPIEQLVITKQVKVIQVEFQLLVLAMEADICLHSFSSP